MMTQQHTFLLVPLFCLLIVGQAGAASTDIDRLMAAGQYQQALSRLQGIATKDKRDPHYVFNLARALAGAGQQQAAVVQYLSLLKTHPKQPEPYNNLAIIYLQQGKLKKAQAMLNEAMLTHSAYAQVYKNLAKLNAAQAQNAYARALQMPAAKRVTGLEVAATLSLPTARVMAQKAPIVTDAIKPYVKPSMVYQAHNNQADNKNGSIEKAPLTRSAEGELVQTRMQAWAKAWSTKNVDHYLSFYSDDYSPAGITRASWIVQRRKRINRPRWIRIRLQHINVTEIGVARLRVRLEQEYAADNYRDVTRKEFILQKLEGEWRIIQERGLGYIVR